MFQVNPWLIATMVIIVTAVFTFVISRVIRVHRRQASTGWEELVGKTAIVKTALEPEGLVLYRGERWKAESETGRVETGDTVVINRVDSLKLYVTKKL